MKVWINNEDLILSLQFEHSIIKMKVNKSKGESEQIEMKVNKGKCESEQTKRWK